MALIIPILKQGLKTVENAYVKVGRIRYDNTTKTASFNIEIFKSKEDRTLLNYRINRTIPIVSGIDMVKQCYDSIQPAIDAVKNEINDLQTYVDANKTDRKKMFELSTMKANTILILDGAADDI